MNKPGTAKVGAISKDQNCKRGDPLTLTVIFEHCHSAEKCKWDDPVGFFDIHCVAKYRNK